MLFTKALIEPFYSPFHFNYSIIRFQSDPFSAWPLQSPSKNGLDKGSKWGPDLLNTPALDKKE